jgi:hypothetical protein
MNQNQTEPKPQDVEEPREEGLDVTICSACCEIVTEPLEMELWKVGDIVTRDGTDEHVIVEMHGNDPTDCMVVRCTKEPSDPWTKLGEEESNLLRRYAWVRTGQLNA